MAGCCKKTSAIFVFANLTPDDFHFWMNLSPRTTEPVRHVPVPPWSKILVTPLAQSSNSNCSSCCAFCCCGLLLYKKSIAIHNKSTFFGTTTQMLSSLITKKFFKLTNLIINFQQIAVCLHSWHSHINSSFPTQFQQQALLLQRNRATRYVSWNIMAVFWLSYWLIKKLC